MDHTKFNPLIIYEIANKTVEEIECVLRQKRKESENDRRIEEQFDYTEAQEQDESDFEMEEETQN